MSLRSRLGGAVEGAMRSVFLTLSNRRWIGRFATRLPLTRGMVDRFVAGETLETALPALRRARDAGFHTTVDILGESVSNPRRPGPRRQLRGGDPRPRRRGPRPERQREAQPDGPRAGPGRRAGQRRPRARGGLGSGRLRPDRHGGPHDHRRDARSLAPASTGHGRFGRRRRRHPVSAATERGGRGAAARRRRADPLVQGRLQGASGRRVHGEGRRGRFVRSAHGAAPDRRDASRRSRRTTIAWSSTRSPSFGSTASGPSGSSSRCCSASGATCRSGCSPQGWAVRIYVPFGDRWYPYFMRRLAERPANVSFVLRSLLRERRTP